MAACSIFDVKRAPPAAREVCEDQRLIGNLSAVTANEALRRPKEVTCIQHPASPDIWGLRQSALKG